ncbi:AAA domain-containing protein [Cryptosporangium arvum]|uniref:AAA domain-containing protein n=1 Tax=Cryptosporangium arvum TaxID=80871 RepID=UPI0004BB0EA1|nr:AAA domain-containing protein [Cryptosporangium arvum]
MAAATDRIESLRTRVSRFSDYLSAVRALSARPARTLEAAETVVWQAALPVGKPGCWIAGAESSAPVASASVDDVEDPDETGTGARADECWLELRRPPRPRPPDLPAVVRSLLDGPVDDPRREPALRDGWREIAAERDADLDLDAVEPAVDEWLQRLWRPWAVTAAEADAVRGAYSRLVELRQAAVRLEASHELVWGFGLFTGVIGDVPVEDPLLAAPVGIDVDPESGALTVVPTGELRLQTDAFEALPDGPDARLHDLAGPGGAVTLDPWEQSGRTEFYRSALRRLGLPPRVIREDAQIEEPHVRDTGVILLRPRRTALSGFLADLRASLAAGHVPSGALAALLADDPSTLDLPDDPPEQWQPIGERLLFPLPANLEQETIARRLARQRMVAVQGPPGTGKTHTIANLICHLVAHGRRVLVVSHRDEPLAEVRDKLPPALRPLAISVMGSSAKQLGQLETAVRQLQAEAGALDQDVAAEAVDELWAALDTAEQDLSAKYHALRAVADRESGTFLLDGVEATAVEVAEWLWANESRLAFVPDTIDPNTPFPLSDAELAELTELTNTYRPEDLVDAQRRLPERESLPDGNRLARADEHAEALRQRLGALASLGVDVATVRGAGRPVVAALADEIWRIAHRARSYQPWQLRLAGRLAVSPAWRETCQAEVAGCAEMLTETARWRSVLAGRAVQIPDELWADPRQLRADLDMLRIRLVEARGVSRLIHRRLAQVRDDIRVDGAPLRTVDDVDAALATVRLDWARRRLTERWNHFVAELDGPQAPDDPSTVEVISGYLREVGDVVDIGLRYWPTLRERLAVFLRAGSPGEADWADPNALAGAAGRAGELVAVFESDEAEREGIQVRALLDEALLDANASPLWRELDRSWAVGDYAAWEAALAGADRLRAAGPAMQRWQELHAGLSTIAPLWASRIALEGDLPDPAISQQAWNWRRADTWLRIVIGVEDTGALGRQADALRDRARELVGELATRSAWLAAALRMDDRARDALAGWASALRKVGKGSGRRAAGWTALAQQHMREAVSAVPVWVMSVERALQQFTGGTTPFDVVIVDEASQCGLLSMPVLSLGTRAVVVGDDRQIGPYAIGLAHDDVARLGQEHLGDLPSWPLFDVTTSLYDHAVRRSPEPLMLTEHFRCVPEIISFSSDQWYDGTVQPLRADRGRLDPVRVVRIPGTRERRDRYGEVNLAEADALVATISRLALDPDYAGLTFGVVSLLASSGQAQYINEQLVRHLGEQEMARRSLKVGDSYTFQGAERDVMFISLVVSDRDDHRAAFTGADHHRRVNVAASRAKDQMWVFHSVGPENLHPDDARGALLRYCAAPRLGLAALAAEPVPDETLYAACESELERSVLRELLNIGIRPAVQYPIGRHRVDFVIPTADGRRLAIECDHGRYRGAARWAEEMRRQAVLERVGGCVFWRVRGTLFARDPDAALAGLWPLMDELGLLPEEYREYLLGAESFAEPFAGEPEEPQPVHEVAESLEEWVEDDGWDENGEWVEEVPAEPVRAGATDLTVVLPFVRLPEDEAVSEEPAGPSEPAEDQWAGDAPTIVRLEDLTGEVPSPLNPWVGDAPTIPTIEDLPLDHPARRLLPGLMPRTSTEAPRPVSPAAHPVSGAPVEAYPVSPAAQEPYPVSATEEVYPVSPAAQEAYPAAPEAYPEAYPVSPAPVEPDQPVSPAYSAAQPVYPVSPAGAGPDEPVSPIYPVASVYPVSPAGEQPEQPVSPAEEPVAPPAPAAARLVPHPAQRARQLAQQAAAAPQAQPAAAASQAHQAAASQAQPEQPTPLEPQPQPEPHGRFEPHEQAEPDGRFEPPGQPEPYAPPQSEPQAQRGVYGVRVEEAPEARAQSGVPGLPTRRPVAVPPPEDLERFDPTAPAPHPAAVTPAAPQLPPQQIQPQPQAPQQQPPLMPPPSAQTQGVAQVAPTSPGGSPVSWWNDGPTTPAPTQFTEATRPLPLVTPPEPANYQEVGAIRADEARAALQAYRSGVDTPVQSGGKIVGWACFYPDDSIEAQRNRANVEVMRQEEALTETAGWLTNSEAAAIVAASEQRRDVPVVDPAYGEVGLVRFAADALTLLRR